MRNPALLLLLLAAACVGRPAGEERRAHPTLVSLNPCTDAVLAQVADPDQILAISHFSHRADSSSMGVEAARRFPATSGTVEEIAAFHPDIVIGDSFVPAATAQALERMGLRLERLPIPADAAASVAQVRELARLVGHAERGEALVARIETALARAAPPKGEAPVSAVLWQSGGMVPGEGTLIADLLRRTGFVQLSAVRGMRQGQILPLELMLADPPRVILVTGDPRSNEDRGITHPALRKLANTRTEPFESPLLWCGGPTIIRAADRLAAVRRSVRGGGT
jgi:iron complex transport system substrate-binding protein